MNLFRALNEHRHDHPDRLALNDGQLTATWGQLVPATHAVSQYFKRASSRHQVIALALPISTVGGIAALGILRAGHTWLQIDTTLSREALAKVLRHANAGAVICRHDDCHLFENDPDLVIIPMDVDVLPGANSDTDDVTLDLASAADLYYTSGSTGEPKGVWKSHNSTMSSATARAQLDGLNGNDRFALFGDWGYSYVRNGFYASLIAGAQMFIPTGRLRNLDRIDRWLDDNKITVTTMIPSAARTVAVTKEVVPNALRLIVLGGEPTTLRDIEIIRSLLPPTCRITNQYGAAEAGYVGTSDVTNCQDQELLRRFRPVPGHHIDIIDPDEEGIGVLKISGPNVSNGYWRNDSLTAERFSKPETGRGVSYRSDDLVRRVDDGLYERCGRSDGRVKIRGFNVYLNDIESSLVSNPLVDEACVLADPRRDNKSLVGYVASSRHKLSAETLRDTMRNDLLSHQIPREIFVLSALPRTARGKVDTAALVSLTACKKTPVNRPDNELEQKLTEIWQAVLGRDDVDVTDDFMDAGGDSLLAVELVNRVGKTLGIEDPAPLLQQGSNIRSMARVIQEHDPHDQALIVLQKRGTKLPLFLIHGGGGDLYNLSHLCSLLPLNRPVYAFRRVDKALVSVDRLAARYVAELRERQPEGPYMIAGYSFGGVVAIAMGKLLIEAGETVSLFMLDVTLKPSWLIGRLARKILLKKPAGHYTFSGSGHLSRLRRLKSGFRRVHAWHLKSFIEFHGYRLLNKPVPERVKSDRYQSLSSLSALAYNVSHYEGHVTVFRALEFRNQRPQDLGWLRMLDSSRLDIVDVPGSHSTMLRPPNVGVLAKRFAQTIAGFDAEDQSQAS